jgi:hypothetical protein
VTTVDLDIVHRRHPENVARLLRVATCGNVDGVDQRAGGRGVQGPGDVGTMGILTV